MEIMIKLTFDQPQRTFVRSAWWLASLVGTYSVIEGKGLFVHSVLVARFVRGHLFGDRALGFLAYRVIVV